VRKALLLFFALTLLSLSTEAQTDRQYQLKAAYIYQFTKFIDWKSTEDPSAVFIIGVLGRDSGIYPYLRAISERHTIKSKVIEIQEIVFEDQVNAIKELNFCDILFVPDYNAEYLDRLLELTDDNTLLIGESPNFAEQGGAINFVEHDGKLFFELNKNAILDNGFKVSNQLLKLAILVEEDRN